jgi:hypothetical protein
MHTTCARDTLVASIFATMAREANAASAPAIDGDRTKRARAANPPLETERRIWILPPPEYLTPR